MFDNSTGFLLSDGSVRSPDTSVVRLERWQALIAEREGFPPLCPDLVVELASRSRPSRSVEVWPPGQAGGAPTPATRNG